MNRPTSAAPPTTDNACRTPPVTAPSPETDLQDHAADQELAALARALSHPARARIVRHLAHARSCVGSEIFDLVPLAQSTISQHLKVLREAGLVTGGGEGPRSGYCLEHDALRRLRVLVSAL